MTLSRRLRNVEHQGGLLVDAQANQIGMVGQDREQPAQSIPLEEVLVDDRAGEEIEPLAHVGLHPAPGDHHAGHHGRPGGGSADHSAPIEEQLELPLDLGAEIGIGEE